ncbi:MAG: hypothetical protein U0892_17870 [Pirellulales bacterium]
MQVIKCPGCGAGLKIPAGVASTETNKIICPKCKKELRIRRGHEPSPTPEQPRDTAAAPLEQQPSFGNDLFPPSNAGSNNTFPGPAVPAYQSTASVHASSPQAIGPMAELRMPEIRSFTKLLGFVFGVHAVLVLLSLPLSFYPKSFVCLIPILLATIGMLAGLFAARIWIIVLGFKKSAAQGVLVLLVPYYWLIFMGMNRRVCLKPLLTLIATLIPVAMCMIVIFFFKPDFDGSGTGSGLQLSGKQLFENRMKLSLAEQKAAPGEITTVQFPVFQVTDPQAAFKANNMLSTMPGYIFGSFKLSADQKSLTLQYKGSDKSCAPYYAMILPGEAGIFVVLQPQFIANPPAP